MEMIGQLDASRPLKTWEIGKVVCILDICALYRVLRPLQIDFQPGYKFIFVCEAKGAFEQVLALTASIKLNLSAGQDHP
jgi:hypothetical protein